MPLLLVGIGALGIVVLDLYRPLLGWFNIPIAIQTIHSSPDLNATVYLKGKVGDRVPLVEGQIYQLQDATGAIWVVTADTSVQTNERLLIRGTVKFQSIPLAGQEQGEVYIEEQTQVSREGPTASDSNR